MIKFYQFNMQIIFQKYKNFKKYFSYRKNDNTHIMKKPADITRKYRTINRDTVNSDDKNTDVKTPLLNNSEKEL